MYAPTVYMYTVPERVDLFSPWSVSSVQPLRKLLTLLIMGLKISRDVDFE
jgi:hypothetical protein